MLHKRRLMKYFIRLTAFALALAAAGAVRAQQAPGPATSKFIVFLRTSQIGSDTVAVARRPDGWLISSTGSIGAPVDLVARNVQARYDPDWKPLELTIDGTVRGQVFGIHVTVDGSTAITHVNNAGQALDRADPIALDTIFLPNPFFALFEAVTPRLMTAASGSTIPIYQSAGEPVTLRVGESETDRIQTVSRLIVARRTSASLSAGGMDVGVEIWADENGRLLRVSSPSQELEYVREDIAAVSSRRVVISRTGDERVNVPANGFNLAGTVSKASSANTRNPAVILVAGSGPLDRDETVAGIPIFGQLAGALADAGLVVLRYDKRGNGQSGGRAEAASITDYADDLRAAVKFMGNRKDVDPRRIAVAGHTEGGLVALLAGSKDSHIAALVLMNTPGHLGSEVILAQQQHILDRSKLSDEEKRARVELQKRIHDAVITGKGWDALPAQLRRQVDTPEYQSILTFDPATVMPKVRQPVLVVQSALDAEIDPSNGDRLASLARSRKRQAPVDLVKLDGVNHLFIETTSAEVADYVTLRGKSIVPSLGSTIAAWLQKTLPAGR
jgi:dienelactone hydrolase